MTDVFVQNLGFYRARFSIQSLFKTTPCSLKRQRENHNIRQQPRIYLRRAANQRGIIATEEDLFPTFTKTFRNEICSGFLISMY